VEGERIEIVIYDLFGVRNIEEVVSPASAVDEAGFSLLFSFPNRLNPP
jgi:hypothetical protein